MPTSAASTPTDRARVVALFVLLALGAGLGANRAAAQEIFAPGRDAGERAGDAAPGPREPSSEAHDPAGRAAAPGPDEAAKGAAAAPEPAAPAEEAGGEERESLPAVQGAPAAARPPTGEGAPADEEQAPPPATPQATVVDLASPVSTLDEGEPYAAVVLDGSISVDVDGRGRVSVAGDTQSLKSVIEEVCRQAGVELLAYGAPDRRYVGRLEDVPLAEALRSMLRSESYLVGFQDHGAPGAERVKWLRVLGASAANGGAGSAGAPQAQPIAVPTPPRPSAAQRFMISSSLLYQAFGTFDPARREQAQREVVTRISDPEQLERFLATDPKELANMFGRYRNSDQTLRRLKSLSDNADIQAKLDAVLAEMGVSAEGDEGAGAE